MITWESKKEQIFEMPTGGAAIMRQVGASTRTACVLVAFAAASWLVSGCGAMLLAQQLARSGCVDSRSHMSGAWRQQRQPSWRARRANGGTAAWRGLVQQTATGEHCIAATRRQHRGRR